MSHQQRAEFEAFMSDGGKFPKAIERNPNGDYMLMQAASSWHVWKSAMQSPNIQQALADSRRIDWLADPGNTIGNVQLPTECVTENMHSLRDAIDAAIRL